MEKIVLITSIIAIMVIKWAHSKKSLAQMQDSQQKIKEEEIKEKESLIDGTNNDINKIINHLNLTRFSFKIDYKKEFYFPSNAYPTFAYSPHSDWYVFLSLEKMTDYKTIIDELKPEKLYGFSHASGETQDTRGRLFIKISELIFLGYKNPYAEYLLSASYITKEEQFFTGLSYSLENKENKMFNAYRLVK